MTLAFFRRHRKWFMVLMFAAVISMVFFMSWRAMWDTFAEWLSSSGPRRVVATMDGRNVLAGEVGEFYTGVKTAGQASQWWAMALDSPEASQEHRRRLYTYTVGMTAWPIISQSITGERVQSDTLLTWLALYREACQLGFGVSGAQVDDRIEALKALGLTGLHLSRVVDEVAGGHHALLIEGLRKDMTLSAYINWLGETLGAAVEPEMRREFAKMDERIKVRLVAMTADEVLPDVKNVPDDALQTQFDKYRTVLTGTAPQGYGYRIPDKVAVEYLVAEPAAFEKEADPAVTDEAVRAYYDANKDPEFLVEQENDTAADADKKDVSGSDDKTREDTAPAEAADTQDDKPPEKTFRPFDDVRAEIRKKLLRREAERLARRRLNEDVAEIRTRRKKPELGIWADGKTLRHVVVNDLLAAEGLAELEGIGKATRGDDAFPMYAVAVVELVAQDKARIGQGEISDVFTDTAGRAYAFRVTAVRKNHEPATLAEVRDDVLADVRRMMAFDIIRERGKDLLKAAATKKSLEDAAKDASLEIVESDLFPRERAIPYGGRWVTFPPSLPKVGSNPIVVAECFRMAEDGRERTLVTVVGRQMVVAAELIERKPPREAAFDAMRPLIAQRVGMRLAQNAVRDVLATGAVQRRMTIIPEVTDDAPDGGEPGDEQRQ